MQTSITTVYDRITNPGIFSVFSHGLSFYIASGRHHIMYDLGLVGRLLIKNMEILDIKPDKINKIVFSHGHSDHTGGLNALLENRTKKSIIPIYAHTNALEAKRAQIGKLRLWNAGIYSIKPELKNKIKFNLSSEPVEITPYLITTGEISLDERIEDQNISSYFVHYVNGEWSIDPVLDEISLILKSKEGLVLICGCCHSGISNTIRKAESLVNDKVTTLIGGVHLYGAKKEIILQIAHKLNQDFKNVKFFFNHSIGRRAYHLLRKKLGENRVNYAPFGKSFVFDC